MKFSKLFLLLTLVLSSMVHAKEKNRFERIVARYPHLSVFLASAAGAAVGVYGYKKYLQYAYHFNPQDNAKTTISLFGSNSNASLKQVALAGAIVGTAIAAAADCGMPNFAPRSNSSVILAK